MSTIDLTLPDFLRAENRSALPQTKNRGGETDRIMPKPAGEVPTPRHTKEPAGAEVSSDR